MPRPQRPPGVLASLRGAWRTVGADPVRILGASMIALLVEAGTLWTLARLVADGAPWTSLLLTWSARCVLVGAARAALIALGAQARARPVVHPWSALPLGVAVEALVGLVTALVVALALAPFGGLAAAIGAQGQLPGALLAVAVGLVAAWTASAAARAALAPLLPRRMLGLRADATTTFSFGLRLVLLGDTLWALGALALVAGALPAFPLTTLAWLDRLAPAPENPA